MCECKYSPLKENVEEMFIGPFGSALKNECFVNENEAYCMVYEQKHAIQKTMDVETRYINEQKYNELKRFNIRGGDIIVSCRGTIGKTFIVPDDAPLGIMHSSIMKIRLKQGIYDKYYFNLLLKSRLKKHAIEANGSGIKMAISATELGKELFPVPSMDKQLTITNVISKISKIVELRKKEMFALDELIRARFVELFECGDHEIVKASDVCDFITKGTTPPTGEITEEYENGKIPFLKVYNLSFTGEMLFDENPQYILAETHNGKLARSKVYPNDVLMNIVGPPLGKFTLVTDEFEEWNINQAIAIFRAKERILPRFLLHALMQPKVLEPFIGQAVGIRQQNLSLEQCRNLQFPLPSLEEQKSFVEFAEQLDKSKVKVQKALDETQKLFDSLMQQYFG